MARTLAGFFQALLLGGLISAGGDKRMGIFMWNPSKREDLDLLRVFSIPAKSKPSSTAATS